MEDICAGSRKEKLFVIVSGVANGSSGIWFHLADTGLPSGLILPESTCARSHMVNLRSTEVKWSLTEANFSLGRPLSLLRCWENKWIDTHANLVWFLKRIISTVLSYSYLFNLSARNCNSIRFLKKLCIKFASNK